MSCTAYLTAGEFLKLAIALNTRACVIEAKYAIFVLPEWSRIEVQMTIGQLRDLRKYCFREQ